MSEEILQQIQFEACHACYYSTQNLSSFLWLSKDTQIPCNRRIPPCYALHKNYHQKKSACNTLKEKVNVIKIQRTIFIPLFRMGVKLGLSH
jgi:hypothetical protein